MKCTLSFTDYGGFQEFRSKRLEARELMADLYRVGFSLSRSNKLLIKRRVPRHRLDLDIIALHT